RARHDRSRRRHVRPLLRREDARGEVRQRHRLRAAGGDDRPLQVERRHSRGRTAPDLRAGCGRRRGARAAEVLYESARGRRAARAFYRGEVAKTTGAFLKANCGIIADADLASYQPYDDAPRHVNYRGIEVYECPPNSQGFVMREALNILEGFNLREMGRNTGA